MKRDTIENIQSILDQKQIRITLSGDYLNQKSPIDCSCNDCGYTWQSTSTNLKKWKGSSCKLCSKASIRSTEDLQKRLDELNKSISVIGVSEKKYKYLVECKVCSREWEANWSSLRSNGCSRCSRKERGSIEKLQALLEPKAISVSGEYKNAYTKINCVCNKCNEEWQSTPHNLTYHGCPFCCFKGRIPKDRHASLYYVRIENNVGTYWKIGITTKSDILSRFVKGNQGSKITLLYSFLFEDGEQAYFAEKNILRLYKPYLNTDKKILADGNTEIFVKDVLQMNHLGGE